MKKRVALLFEEKREERQMRKQMDNDLNEMMNKTEVFSKSLAQHVLKGDSESSPGSSRAVSRAESGSECEMPMDQEMGFLDRNWSKRLKIGICTVL